MTQSKKHWSVGSGLERKERTWRELAGKLLQGPAVVQRD